MIAGFVWGEASFKMCGLASDWLLVRFYVCVCFIEPLVYWLVSAVAQFEVTFVGFPFL